jgi:predicted Zn-dependent peptidase
MVGVHYGVGFRAEGPGQEGFAHLFEHLMFEGSESVPRGAFRGRVYEVGGIVNGTTHQDYTDYYQVVPEPFLERALFHEADRMRAPSFTRAALDAQLEEVGAEITRAMAGRPFGGLPWPLLPGVMFTDHANAHDGYGDVARLATVTPDDCAAFFHDHYAPGNAVLTVAGAFDPERALRLVERHFGDIPPRPWKEAAGTGEALPDRDRLACHTEPDVPALAVALGYRLPDPGTDLPGYAAHMVLARLLEESGDGLAGASSFSTGCGFFAPLDARDPDALVLSAALPPDADADRLIDAVRDTCRVWAEQGAPPDTPDAASAAADEYQEHHGSLGEYGRALGRMEILFGRFERVGEVPRLLEAVAPGAVQEAAKALAAVPVSALVIGPGPTRTRPAPPSAAAFPSTGPAAVDVAVTAHGPRPLPRSGPGGDAVAPEHVEARCGGTRVIAFRDDRTRRTRLRARLPLGREGWGWPETAQVAAAELDARLRAEARGRSLRGGSAVTTDGQWLSVTVTASGGVVEWIDALADAVGADGPAAAPRAALVARRPPEQLMEDVQRALWLGGRGEAPPDPVELVRGAVGCPGGVLVVVGDVDPQAVAVHAEHVLSGWGREAPPSGIEPSAHLERVRVPGMDDVLAGLSAPEPRTGPGEAERYLALAVFGAYHDSRLARRLSARGPADSFVASVGRDVLLDRPRVYARTRAVPHHAEALVAEFTAEAERMVDDPPSAAEVDRARTYCSAQLLSALDSPGHLADVLVSFATAGRPADWLWRLPGELRAVTVAGAGAAGAALLRPDAFGGVLLGAVPDPRPLPGAGAVEQGMGAG